MLNGEPNTRGFVLNLTNASRLIHGNPMASDPASALENQRRAGACCALLEFTEYSSTFASTIFIQRPTLSFLAISSSSSSPAN